MNQNTFLPFLVLLSVVCTTRAVEPTVPAEPAKTTSAPAAPRGIVELKSAQITFLQGKGAKIVGSAGSAKKGDTLAESVEIETGTEPVTELTFEDGSVLRLGEKTKISFVSKERIIRLEQGYLLASTPEGNGGITVQGGAPSGTVSGSSVMAARDGNNNFSFLVLESSGSGSVTGGSAGPTLLGIGEMTTIRAGSAEPPEVLDVHIDAVRDICPLFQQIATNMPGDKKVVGSTIWQADDIQGSVKLLSSLEDYKLTENDPEGAALAMLCAVGSNEIGAAENILLRPLDTAAGAEQGSEQGSLVAVGGGSALADARQAEAEPLISAITPNASGDGLAGTDTAAGDLADTDTAAGGGGAGADTQPPQSLSPVLSPTTGGLTTPF